MSKPFYKGRLSINKEKSSPCWIAPLFNLVGIALFQFAHVKLFM
ncbi:hypothetical protein [Akkermansia muciniphila]|nr:hypothetical protein [Akkermansia muciniphila]